ncbi:MAG: DUF2927 domain-containing protein [Alphaproteobacteria bacterium]|nr:DUF2927 domain-containing protein [Alphaproteobacteria bacterium]NNF23519.1 DUF2927 domain-containing protein [Paracoccaceae bacterium]
MARAALALTLLLAALSLAGCDLVAARAPNAVAPVPVQPPAPPPQRSAESLALETYYTRIQSSLLTQGLLRVDGGGIDTPYTADMLAENFIRIALFEEYTEAGGRLISRQSASSLRRWETPVRIGVIYGETVSREIRQRDTMEIERYAARLARVSGHPVRRVTSGANYHVFIVNENELRSLGPRIRAIIPSISDAAIRTVETLPRTSYCLVFASNPTSTGAYDTAVAVIRAEHPDLLRRSCIHEELAQGLGLANDSPLVRPSIFNDDEEFGLLTRHDEQLLRILYDPRLRTGMRASQARPIARRIAEELVAGPS